jgi:hypothetical protein
MAKDEGGVVEWKLGESEARGSLRRWDMFKLFREWYILGNGLVQRVTIPGLHSHFFSSNLQGVVDF